MTYRGQTDRRFNDYHYSWPKDWWYIDLDGVEVCNVCKEAILLREVSRDREKATSILGRLAQRAGVRAHLVIVPETYHAATFDDSTEISWRRIGDATWHDDTLGGYQLVIEELRQAHLEDEHPWRLRREPA